MLGLVFWIRISASFYYNNEFFFIILSHFGPAKTHMNLSVEISLSYIDTHDGLL